VYFAFDLLWLNGEDLRELPLARTEETPALYPSTQIFLHRLCSFREWGSGETVQVDQDKRSRRLGGEAEGWQVQAADQMVQGLESKLFATSGAARVVSVATNFEVSHVVSSLSLA
jgi:hypothetical protein